MNVYAPNPAADRKLFWAELVDYEPTRACLMARDMNLLTDSHDTDYDPMWSENEKAAMQLEQDPVDDMGLQNAWPLTQSNDEQRDGYTRCHVQLGGALVQCRIDRVHIPLLWSGARSQVQVVPLGVSYHRRLWWMLRTARSIALTIDTSALLLTCGPTTGSLMLSYSAWGTYTPYPTRPLILDPSVHAWTFVESTRKFGLTPHLKCPVKSPQDPLHRVCSRVCVCVCVCVCVWARHLPLSCRRHPMWPYECTLATTARRLPRYPGAMFV